MIQQQILEYIKSQLKLGVSRDDVKSALVGTGWLAQDVEDSIKSAEGVGAAVSPQGPSPVKEIPKDKPIVVSDLVSVSKMEIGFPAEKITDVKTAVKPVEKKIEPPKEQPKKEEPKKDQPKVVSVAASVSGSRFNKTTIILIVLAVLAAGGAGGAGYFYFQNKNLNEKIAGLEVAAQGGNTVLNNKIADLTSKNESLGKDLDAAKKESADILFELSFFAIPPGSTDNSPVAVPEIKGTLKKNKLVYSLLTPRGSELTIKNSSDKNVDAALKGLVGTEITLSGTYLPGSRGLTVQSVNGTSVEAPAPAPTVTSTTIE